MTVKELKELLENFNDDREVRLKCQDEGGFYPGNVEITDVITKTDRTKNEYVLLY